MRKTVVTIMMLLALAGDGGARIENRPTTLGRELMDEACQIEAIGEDEHHSQRQKLLNRK